MPTEAEGEQHVIRGGSWYSGRVGALASCRAVGTNEAVAVGFGVVAPVDTASSQ